MLISIILAISLSSPAFAEDKNTKAEPKIINKTDGVIYTLNYKKSIPSNFTKFSGSEKSGKKTYKITWKVKKEFESKTIIYAKVKLTKKKKVKSYTILYNKYGDKIKTIKGSRDVYVDNGVKWVELNTNAKKEKYKWFFQKRSVVRTFATKKVVKFYLNNKYINTTSYNNLNYTLTKEYQKNDDKSKYVLSSEFVQSDNKFFYNLAKKIIKNNKTDYDKAQAILSWMQVNYKYGNYGGSRYDALTAYSQGKVHGLNCIDSAHLTSALLRALNIPVRYKQNGYEDGDTFYGHVWIYTYVKHNGSYKWLCGQPSAEVSSYNESLEYGLNSHSFFPNWCALDHLEGYYLVSHKFNMQKFIRYNNKWFRTSQYVIFNNKTISKTWIY
ncbi:transglutaminase-like domain-containing protein [Methanobrevibacter filiformis]|uniref:Transglutaminase-like superfamily protein n=1 Tax=Methanobrevibacter filiformis TaxID=55758 RepID=A0A166CCU1_9EURY|nr:transglutaminase-like domain-containing protein [Methanobrevibacter filiformis]KZX14375.1 transglutaminase-like superfamily protein [Methanobrevibacter filiformis]